MAIRYNFDHSQAIAAGAIYHSNELWRTGWASYVHNNKDPSHIAVACMRYGANEQYIMLLVTAESPKVVYEKLLELKSQFGIDSKALQQPPSGLETELRIELVALQSQFARLRTAENAVNAVVQIWKNNSR